MNASKIRNVTCLGCGTIGASWALNFAMRGLRVTVYDVSEEAFDSARKLIKESLDILESAGALDAHHCKQILDRIYFTDDIEQALKNAHYIQESVPDSLELKHEMVEAIEKYAPVTALVGSSTSRQNISDICANAQHKERYVGAHPYNPPHLVPLVEISKGPETSREAMDAVYGFFRSIKKQPIRIEKEVHGFVGNRIQAVVNRELIDLVGRGVVSFEDAQRAITFGPGFRWAVMGHHLIWDLGSPKGLFGMKSVSASGINILDDVATWTKNPYPRSIYKLDQARENILPEGARESREAAAKWRDQMLLKLLKAHELL